MPEERRRTGNTHGLRGPQTRAASGFRFLKASQRWVALSGLSTMNSALEARKSPESATFDSIAWQPGVSFGRAGGALPCLAASQRRLLAPPLRLEGGAQEREGWQRRTFMRSTSRALLEMETLSLRALILPALAAQQLRRRLGVVQLGGWGRATANRPA